MIKKVTFSGIDSWTKVRDVEEIYAQCAHKKFESKRFIDQAIIQTYRYQL